MSGVIDSDGTQWEHCNGCGEFVRMDDLLYGRIRPELIEAREARIDAWVAEAENAPKVPCTWCAGTGTRPDGDFAWCGGCNGCLGAGEVSTLGHRGRGERPAPSRTSA
jgi:hypothetical protein